MRCVEICGDTVEATPPTDAARPVAMTYYLEESCTKFGTSEIPLPAESHLDLERVNVLIRVNV